MEFLCYILVAYDSVCLLVITEHSHYGLPMYAVLSGAQLIRGVTPHHDLYIC